MSIYLRAQIDKSILRGYWWIDGAPQNQYRMLARRVHDVATVESKFDELKQLQYSVLGKKLEQAEDSTKLRGVPDVKVWQNFLVREPFVSDEAGLTSVRRSDSIASQVKTWPEPQSDALSQLAGDAPKGCLRLPYRSLWRGSFEMPTGEVVDGEEMCLTLTPSAPGLPVPTPMSPLHASAERAAAAVMRSQGDESVSKPPTLPQLSAPIQPPLTDQQPSTSAAEGTASGNSLDMSSLGDAQAPPSAGAAASSEEDASSATSSTQPLASGIPAPQGDAPAAPASHTTLPPVEATRVAAISRLKVLGEGTNKLGRFTLTGSYDVSTGLIASEKSYHAIPSAGSGASSGARQKKRKRSDSRKKQSAGRPSPRSGSGAASGAASTTARRRSSPSHAAGGSTHTGFSGTASAVGHAMAVVDGTLTATGEPVQKQRRILSTLHHFGIAPPLPGTPAAAAAAQAAMEASQLAGGAASGSGGGRGRKSSKAGSASMAPWMSHPHGVTGSPDSAGGSTGKGSKGTGSTGLGVRSWMQEGMGILSKGGVSISGAVGSEWCEAHRLLPEAGLLAGDLYEGEIKDGQPHGIGTVVYRNGFMFEGMFQNGIESGYGVIVDEHDQILYEGTVSDGLLNGKGKFTLPNGDIYSGGWKDGLFHGRGLYVVRSGGKYDGSWRDGVRDGAGDMQYPDGSEFSGLWRDGKRHGKGTFRHPNGFSYFGLWADDAMEGNGRAVYPDASAYEGQFKGGRRDGRGRYSFSNGMELNGRWKEDGLQGSGGTLSMQQTVKVNDDCSMIPINISTDLEKVHLRAGFTRSGS